MNHSSSFVRWGAALVLGVLVLSAGSLAGAGDEAVLLDTNNPQAVEAGPAAPAVLELARPHVITRIRTYHWNGGRGATRPRLVIDDPQEGVQYGPWEAVGEAPRGEGRALYWVCRPNLRLAAGRYELRAFDPTTWSQNRASDRQGMCEVRGLPAEAPGAGVPSPSDGAFATEPLAAFDLTPEHAGRPLPAGDGLRVTLPASVVADGGRLTVARARPLEPATCGSFEAFGVYDVSIGSRHEFADELVLECRYDPARLEPTMAPEDQVLAVRWDPARRLWVEQPSRLDPARGVIVTRTRHLSVNAWIYNAKIFAYETVRHLTETVIRTKHFRFYYDPEELRTSRAARRWKGETSFPAAYEGLWVYKNPAWIPLVRDIAYYLERSYAEYDAADLTPVAAVPIRVDIGPGRAGKDPAQYEHQSHTMLVSSDKIGSTTAALQHVFAHELFHSIQNKDWKGDAAKIVAPATLWWVESTAEYAACNVAWKLASMGGGPAAVYPYLLERPLTESGLPAAVRGISPVGEIEYDKGYFLDYLVRRGVKFTGLYKGVMKGHLETGRLLAALEGYLTANGPQPLPALYREYVAWFLFDVEGPIGQGRRPDPMRSATNPGRKAAVIPATDAPPPLRHAFNLPAPYTAATWAVRVAPGFDGEARNLEVRAPALDAWAVVDVYRLPDGQREAWPSRVAGLSGPAETARVELEPGQTLFLTAINLDGASRPAQATVEVEVKPEKPQPPPATAPTPTAAPGPATGHWVLTGTKPLDGGVRDLGKVTIAASASPGSAKVVYSGDPSKGADFTHGLLEATWSPAQPPAKLGPEEKIRFEGTIRASGGSPGKGGVEIFPEGYLEMHCVAKDGSNCIVFRASAGTPPSDAWRTQNRDTANLRMYVGAPGEKRTLTIYLNTPSSGVGFEYTYTWQQP